MNVEHPKLNFAIVNYKGSNWKMTNNKKERKRHDYLPVAISMK